MRRFNLILILLVVSNSMFGQNDNEVHEQKGFLFISAYNYRHDWDGWHMRPLGFHDFFFPNQWFNLTTQMDSSIFKEGIRVDSIPMRFYVKKKAAKVLGSDTSRCYGYDSFYIIPVLISFREIEEYEPLVCGKNSFVIQQGNIKREFYFQRRAILVTKIVLYPDDKKKSELL